MRKHVADFFSLWEFFEEVLVMWCEMNSDRLFGGLQPFQAGSAASARPGAFWICKTGRAAIGAETARKPGSAGAPTCLLRMAIRF